MQLYFFHGATCATKTRLIVAEKGAQVDMIEVDALERAGAVYRGIHPKGLVPALVDGDFVLTESTTIMRYIDEVCPGPAMQPSDPRGRARMNNWLKRFDEELFPVVGYLSLGLALRANFISMPREQMVERFQESSPNSAVAAMRIDVVENGVRSEAVAYAFRFVRHYLQQLDTALGQTTWLTGEAFGLADAAHVPAIVRFDEFGFSELWQSLPHFSAWWAAATARSSFDAVLRQQANPMAEALRLAGESALPHLLALD